MSERTVAVPGIPYRGIHPFRYADHAIFFARGEETRQLAVLVSVYRGVLLYGDSGSGKSSLVNAGLIPEAIRLGFAPEWLRVQPRDAEELVVERIRSTDDDGAELLPSALAPDGEPSARTVLAMDAFEERVRAACEGHRPLLIFDQFEEIVTLFDEAGAHDARRRLAELLVRLLRGSLPVKILLSFREDYLGRIKELLSACPELVDQALRITPPAADALPTIIRGPFERYPHHFARELSPALTGRLATVLAERFGAGDISLSEVQTVCLRLWQSHNPDALLTEKGPQGLLEDYLGEALDDMPAELRPTAIALLAQMVTTAGTRNVISAGDLFQRVQEQEGGITPSLLDQALEGLSQSRLVRRERRRDLDLYEITSEFLVPWISRRRDEFRQSQNRRRERRRLLIVASIAAALVLVTLVVATLYIRAQGDAQKAAAEAKKAAILALASDAQTNAQKGPDVALLLSLAALAPSRAGPGSPTVARSNMIAALETTKLEGMAGILHGDAGPVNSVAISPDGRTLASGSADGTVRLWDVATHKQVGSTLTTDTLPVSSVAFSLDGHTLASGSDDGTVRLWDVATHKQVGSALTTNDSISIKSIAFSPDGRILASGDDVGNVQLWNLATHKPLGSPLPGFMAAAASSIAFSHDGRTLAAGFGGDDETVELWDLTTRKLIGSVPAGNIGDVVSVAFSHDGRTLAVGGDGTVQLWDAATRQHLGPPLTGETGPVISVAFSPHGHALAAGSEDGTVLLWDAATRQPLGPPLTSASAVDSVTFSPGGGMLAAGSGDGTVRLWDLATAEQAGSPLPGSGVYQDVAFGPGGRVVAADELFDTDTVQLWDVASHKQLGPNLPGSGGTTSVAFSPKGHLLAAGGDNTVLLWDAVTHKSLGSLPADKAAGIYAVAFSHNGRMLAAAGPDGTVLLWNVATRRRLNPPLPGNVSTFVRSIAFSRDNRTLATAAGEDGKVRLWDLATHTQLGLALSGNTGDPFGAVSVNSVAFSPNGRTLASGGDDGTVRLWDVATHKQLGLLPGNTGPVNSVAFSPNGRMLVSGSDDGTVRLWDLATHTQLGLPLTSNTGPVTSVAFSPDGVTLASVSSSTVRLWSGFLWRDFAGLRKEVCSLVGTGLSRTEWKQYAPGIAYQQTCP